MITEFLVIFLFAGVNTQEQTNEQQNPLWEGLFEQWSQLEKNVLNNQQISSNLVVPISNEIKLEKLLLQIRSQIEARAVQQLKSALVNSSYSENEEIMQITDALFNVNETVFDEVICSVINESVLSVPMNELIDELSSHRNASQNVAALCCIESLLRYHASISDDSLLQLTEKLENNTNLSSNRIFEIHSNLLTFKGVERNQMKLTDKILEMKKNKLNYENLREAKKTKIENIIQKLPKFLKDLYLSRVVCIRSVAFQDHYLWYSDDFDFDNGYEMTLHKGKPKDNERNGKWFPKKSYALQFYFPSRYIYDWFIKMAADLERVFCRAKIASFWQIELHANGIYFRDYVNNLYLCPFNSTNKFEIRGQNLKSLYCLWVVEECH